MEEKVKTVSLAELGIITDGELDLSDNPAAELVLAGIQMGRLSTQIQEIKRRREQVMLGFMAEEERAREAFGINFFVTFGSGDDRVNVYWPGFQSRETINHIAVTKTGFYMISQESEPESLFENFSTEMTLLNSLDPSITPNLSVTENEKNKQILFFEKELRKAAVRRGFATTDWKVTYEHTRTGEAPVLTFGPLGNDPFKGMSLKADFVDDNKEKKFLREFLNGQQKRREEILAAQKAQIDLLNNIPEKRKNSRFRWPWS